jgi:hypothetical protein
MTTFTPGIWTINDDIRTAINAGQKHVALANFSHYGDPERDVYGEEHKANARLIAAAPLLFSALQRIVRNGYLVDDVPDDVLNQALKALEQVEGDE